jgi:type VI secretion system protein ImpE
MTSHELYQAGKLTEAVAAALKDVKAKPADTASRGLLCELLLFVGDLERADKQLETIGQQDAQSIPGISMLRQLVRAETARQQFFREGRLPEFLSEVSPHLRLHLDASIALREGNGAEAAALLAQAEEQRPHCRGTCDGQAFDDWRDVDDLTAPFFEVLTSTGKYYWVPVERVSSLEFRPAKRPQDLLWRRAQMVVREGPDGEVFLPALYAGTQASDDDQLRLGRGTTWQGGDGSPARGTGQRIFLVGDQDRPIMQLGMVEFHSV